MEKVIFIGCLIMAVTAIFYGYVHSFILLLVINVIRGFALAWYDIAAGIAPLLCPIVLLFSGSALAFVILGSVGVVCTFISYGYLKRSTQTKEG